MSKLTICLSYYNQSKEVLMKHINCWKNYPQEIINKIEFFLVDDCSKIEAKQLLKDENLNCINFHLYRVGEDLYCNIAGVRNLSAKECKTKWMLIIDMDTLIDENMIEQIFELINKDIPKHVYKFNRKVPENKNHLKHDKIHPAVCLIRKEDYWRIGGCEEDLVGHYGGTDPSFWYKSKWDKPDRLIKLIFCNNIYITYLPEGESDIVRDTKHNNKLIDERKKNGKWSTDYIRFKWHKQI